ncbi:hypothetical protein R1flu_014564 [Riccia fluitans]|uniref:CDP-diacylglycerol--glycerol-3-phosphate 3-phosphatidyltransferase n=1 Tax=Riccia fluitans TaxID=41844 RepID=A0ABD1YGQ5_9MARC
MTISAARQAASPGARRVVTQGLPRPLGGVHSTRTLNWGTNCCPLTSTSPRSVSKFGQTSLFTGAPRSLTGVEIDIERDGTLNTGKRCLGSLFQAGQGRKKQSIASAEGTVDECPLCRYAVGSKSQLSSSSIFALGTMRVGGDGWRRKGAAALVHEDRKKPYSRRAFADDDSKSEAAVLNNGDTKKSVTPQYPKTKLLTLPTILTLARVAAVPALLAVFYCKETWATAAGVAIFIIAAVTDWLDGYLARKMGSSSAFGAFLDPVADKLMVAAALVLLCTRPLPVSGLATTPWLLPLPTIAIIGREITMSAVREWAAAQGADVLKAVAVNNLGKIKTASQMIAITLLLATGDGGVDSRIASYVGIMLLYVAAGLALWSLAMYMKGIWSSLSK